MAGALNGAAGGVAAAAAAPDAVEPEKIEHLSEPEPSAAAASTGWSWFSEASFAKVNGRRPIRDFKRPGPGGRGAFCVWAFQLLSSIGFGVGLDCNADPTPLPSVRPAFAGLKDGYPSIARHPTGRRASRSTKSEFIAALGLPQIRLSSAQLALAPGGAAVVEV